MESNDLPGSCNARSGTSLVDSSSIKTIALRRLFFPYFGGFHDDRFGDRA